MIVWLSVCFINAILFMLVFLYEFSHLLYRAFSFLFFFLLNTDFNKVKSILKKGFLFIYIDKTILTCCTWPCLWLNHLNLFCTNIIYQKLVVTNLIYFFYSRLIQLRHLYKLKKMIIKNLYFQMPVLTDNEMYVYCC